MHLMDEACILCLLFFYAYDNLEYEFISFPSNYNGLPSLGTYTLSLGEALLSHFLLRLVVASLMPSDIQHKLLKCLCDLVLIFPWTKK